MYWGFLLSLCVLISFQCVGTEIFCAHSHSLSLMFLIFFAETIIPPSDLDNDIQGVVTIPLAGPDLVG